MAKVSDSPGEAARIAAIYVDAAFSTVRRSESEIEQERSKVAGIIQAAIASETEILLNALKEISKLQCSCMSTTDDDWHGSRCFKLIARAALAKAGRL
jgi:hypothetical protein